MNRSAARSYSSNEKRDRFVVGGDFPYRMRSSIHPVGWTFEYVGHGSLTVRGAVSGRAYRFARGGDRIDVAYDDAFAMMAERDLRPTAR